jgi:hypothetical protein
LNDAIDNIFFEMHYKGFEGEGVTVAQLAMKPMENAINANLSNVRDILDSDNLNITDEDPTGTDLGLDVLILKTFYGNYECWFARSD